MAAVVLAVLALGLTAWRWDSIGDREQVQLGVGSPSRGPASETAAPTTAATTAPRSSPPATTTATPTGTPSPSQQPSTADRTTPSPRPGTVPSTGASPTPAPAPALPTHRLVIHLSPLSTGAINVGIRGAAAGSCSDAGEDCAFSIRSGDRVTLDPVDVVPAWGPGPCAGTGAATECAFTATADNQLDLWVLRLAG